MLPPWCLPDLVSSASSACAASAVAGSQWHCRSSNSRARRAGRILHSRRSARKLQAVHRLQSPPMPACCSEASRPAALGNGRATLCLGFPAKLHRAATAADHERSRHPIRHRNDATMGTRSATQTTRRQAESAGNFERRYRTAVCITMRIPTPEKNIMIDIMRSRPEPSCISRHIAIIVI